MPVHENKFGTIQNVECNRAGDHIEYSDSALDSHIVAVPHDIA
jgi:hypothetical protein